MKFKVGQMVRVKGDRWFNKGELLKIVELDRSNKLYRCKGTDKTYWQNESDLEPFPQTLEGKLELFKAGTHVLHTPTQEIYDKFIEELEKRGLILGGSWRLKSAKKFWSALGKYTCVLYVPSVCHCGTKEYYAAYGKEILELTLDDFNDSEQEEHMKITIETDGHHKTTAECNGITAESLCNPMDDFKLPKGVHMAVQRLLEKLEEPEEDTGFHMGDIVEVVANEFNFEGNPIGLQGIVKRSYKGGANVQLPTRDEPLTFYNRELKLIRRGNNYEQL